MSEEELRALLEEYEDEELAALLEFIEQMGSIDDARAAIDALNEQHEAA